MVRALGPKCVPGRFVEGFSYAARAVVVSWPAETAALARLAHVDVGPFAEQVGGPFVEVDDQPAHIELAASAVAPFAVMACVEVAPELAALEDWVAAQKLAAAEAQQGAVADVEARALAHSLAAVPDIAVRAASAAVWA